MRKGDTKDQNRIQKLKDEEEFDVSARKKTRDIVSKDRLAR
jgi:hypothetical protein